MHKLMFSVVMVGSFAAFVPEAHALDAECMSKFGECSVSNAPDDSVFCDCGDGGAGGGGGGNEWQDLNQAQLEAVCEEQLLSFCGPPEPPDGVPCENELGVCYVDNEPDSIFCECAGGQGGGGGGGDMWDGLGDVELEAVCYEELEFFCGDPPDPDWMCENKLGGCSIDFGEGNDPFVSCGCTEGGGGFFPGDPNWAGLSEDELLEVCFGQIDDMCDFVDPSESESDSEVTTDSESDSDPTTDSDSDPTSGSEEGGSSDETGGETTGGETTEAESSSSAGESESATMTASATDSDSATMTDPSASASNTAGEESSSGGDGGATGEPSGCSCSAANDEPPLGLALGVLGLVGMRIRRRWRR